MKAYGSIGRPRDNRDGRDAEHGEATEAMPILTAESIGGRDLTAAGTLSAIMIGGRPLNAVDKARALFGIVLVLICIIIVSMVAGQVPASSSKSGQSDSVQQLAAHNKHTPQTEPEPKSTNAEATFTKTKSTEKSPTGTASAQTAITPASSSMEALVISASNEYGDPSVSMLPYPFLQDALLAEPYKQTTFTISNTQSGCSYTWSITDSTGGVVQVNGGFTKGQLTTSSLRTVGEYSLSVSESGCDDSSYARTLTKSVWVKYVRRELSSLTDSDRETFLDALSTLWKVDTLQGVALYGSKYKSLYYFASIHNDAGANGVCDEFHGDQGFINNHMMLSAYLEQSLQLVEPRTCLHYMDYSKYFGDPSFTDRKSICCFC
jgi:hypothetical protein